MKENNKDEEGIIIFGEYEKIVTFPKAYDDLINNIISLFNIPENKKSLLLISYKILFGDSVNIYSQEEYNNFLQKLSQNDVENILSVCIQESIRNKIKSYNEDIYDKDDDEEEKDDKYDKDDLRRGHVFEKKNEAQSNIFSGERLNINKILNDSFEEGKNDENNINNINNSKDKMDIMFNNDIVKSVLPPVASFPTYCNVCQKFPLVKVLYFCLNCQLFLCEDCEKNLGYNHRHCYYKIRNKEQYQEILKFENQKLYIKVKNENDNNKKSRMAQLKEKKEGFDGIFNSIFEFMTGTKDNTGSK
jgi:hypothetical protein